MSSGATEEAAVAPSVDITEFNKMDPEGDDDDDEASDRLNNNSPLEDAVSGSKRSREDDEDLSRSERKRNREKNRRNSLNYRLEALAALLFKIDPTLKSGKGDNAIMNRVNLIQSAVQTLERIHKENEERKLLITDLSGGTGKGGQTAAALQGATNADSSEADFLAALAARRQRAFMADQQALFAGLSGGLVGAGVGGVGSFLGGRMDHLFPMGMGATMMNPGFDMIAAQRRMFAQAQGLGAPAVGLAGGAAPAAAKREDVRSTAGV